MAKKFVDITQIYRVRVIMDIGKNETDESVMKRIEEHLKNNGGAETVICGDGEIGFDVVNDEKPIRSDEDDFECID